MEEVAVGGGEVDSEEETEVEAFPAGVVAAVVVDPAGDGNHVCGHQKFWK